MNILDIEPQIEADDFARRFKMRANNLMWLLGAGASASAGIPTANDMIWEFKQKLYVSQRRVSPKSVADLSNATIRTQLQSYIDSSEAHPKDGAAEEYAALFEAVWPNEGDRRAYIDAKVSGGKPSYGHFALATLMKARLTKIVWTTNFDSLIADACAKVYDSTAPLTNIALDAPDLAMEAINSQRWPIEIKLHGDFRSRRLKNTNDELRQQDSRLRQVFVNSCRSAGMIVAGYSGRDDSIMDTMMACLEQPAPFPSGLFWLHRGDIPPLPRVLDLLDSMKAKGVDGGIVRIENFDETLRDLMRLMEGIDTRPMEQFTAERRWWTAPPKPSGKKSFPKVRLNALQVYQSPSVCRRVVCDIGGHAEVRNAVEVAGVDILFARTQRGILAFGSDSDVRTALDSFGIREFDLYPIELRRLRYDSGERGLLREAISRALAREHRLQVIRRRNTDLLAPIDPANAVWDPLRKMVGILNGDVPRCADLQWSEGIGVRLGWADERLWLLVEPRTVFYGVVDENRSAATDFARERTVRRYNKQLDAITEFWISKLANRGEELRTLGISAGVDAVFRLSTIRPVSARLRP